jgi:hypothetical protein
LIDNREYTVYKELKAANKINYRGYLMQDILATDFAFHAYGRLGSTGVINTFKNLISIKDTKNFEKQLVNHGVLFTTSNYGKDHRNLLDAIVDDLDRAFIYTNISRRKLKFNIVNLLISFWQIFFKHKTNVSFFTQMFFFSKLVRYKNLIDELEKIATPINIKSYVAHLSCLADDSIYCQFFKKRGVNTYCIQHGVFNADNEYKTKIPLDVINIENFQADYMLGWGDSVRLSMIKQGFRNEQFVLAGNPKFKNNKKISLKKSDFNNVVVCLARDLYLNENLQLLEIVSNLESFGIKAFIKLHPRSNTTLYARAIDQNNLQVLEQTISLNESIIQNNIDFTIVYNSTVYYEFYILGLISFRFSINENDIIFGLNDSFSNYEELVNKINKFKTLNYIELSRDANIMVNKFCALGVNNYKNILC